jgi:hypothetical protein
MPLEAKSDAKQEFPAQARGRRQWQLDAIRSNQRAIASILIGMNSEDPDDLDWAIQTLRGLYRMDREAILLPNGILDSWQLEILEKIDFDGDRQ